MKLLILFSCLLVFTTYAQSQLTTEELDGRVLALQGQRDEANNRVVLLSGVIAKQLLEIEQLKKAISVCKTLELKK